MAFFLGPDGFNSALASGFTFGSDLDFGFFISD